MEHTQDSTAVKLKQSVAARAVISGCTVRDALTYNSKRKKVNPHG